MPIGIFLRHFPNTVLKDMLCMLEIGELLQFLQTSGRVIVNRSNLAALVQQMVHLSPGLFLPCCQRSDFCDMLFVSLFCPAYLLDLGNLFCALEQLGEFAGSYCSGLFLFR